MGFQTTEGTKRKFEEWKTFPKSPDVINTAFIVILPVDQRLTTEDYHLFKQYSELLGEINYKEYSCLVLTKKNKTSSKEDARNNKKKLSSKDEKESSDIFKKITELFPGTQIDVLCDPAIDRKPVWGHLKEIKTRPNNGTNDLTTPGTNEDRQAPDPDQSNEKSTTATMPAQSASATGLQESQRSIVEPNEDLRIVIFGQTGSGKSSTGNSILGYFGFKEKEGLDSGTKICQQKILKLASGKTIMVVDTPGIDEFMGRNRYEVMHEVSRCLLFTKPGPHVLLFVLKYGRITKADYDAYHKLRAFFDPLIYMHIILVFTHADDMITDKNKRDYMDIKIDKLEDEVQQAKKDQRIIYSVKNILKEIRGGYVLFDNMTDDPAIKAQQVNDLLNSISELQSKNHFPYFGDVLTVEAAEHMIRRIAVIMQEEDVDMTQAWQNAEINYMERPGYSDADKLEEKYFGEKPPPTKEPPPTKTESRCIIL